MPSTLRAQGSPGPPSGVRGNSVDAVGASLTGDAISGSRLLAMTQHRVRREGRQRAPDSFPEPAQTQAGCRASLQQGITESQTGRGWQGPLWVTQPNPMPKQGHPEQAAQDLVQAGLE